MSVRWDPGRKQGADQVVLMKKMVMIRGQMSTAVTQVGAEGLSRFSSWRCPWNGAFTGAS